MEKIEWVPVINGAYPDLLLQLGGERPGAIQLIAKTGIEEVIKSKSNIQGDYGFGANNTELLTLNLPPTFLLDFDYNLGQNSTNLDFDFSNTFIVEENIYLKENVRCEYDIEVDKDGNGYMEALQL